MVSTADILFLISGGREDAYRVSQDSGGSEKIDVWEEGVMGMPEPTIDEMRALPQILPALKAAKKRELYWAADEQARVEIPMFLGLQTAAKVGANQARAANNQLALSAREQWIRDRIQAGQQKLGNLEAQVDAATTVAAVEAIRWN